MQIFGWIAAVAGSGLFLAALVRTVRANPDTGMPFYRNPAFIPPGSIVMRSIGMGLLIFGAVALTASLGSWSLAVVLGAPLAALALVTIHNLRLTREQLDA